MSSNFITNHVIQLIEKEIESKKRVTKQINFYYFEDPIVDGKRVINRVSQFNPFEKEEIVPCGWRVLSGGALVEIYDRLKNNEFYFYKQLEIDGKTRSYKARLKKKNVENTK